MKRLAVLFLALLLTVFGVLPLAKASAAPPNLVPNPSAEASTTGLSPDNWLTGKWGTNSATFSWDTAAHTGVRALKVDMTSYTDGDAKWYFTPIPVTAGATYNLSEWYRATVPTQVLVQFDNGTTYNYLELGTKPATDAWAQITGSFTVPAGFTHATVFHVISSVGTLSTDDYSVTQAAALNVHVTAPAANSTVSGVNVPLRASVSGDGTIAGVQFKVDGVNVGSEVTAAPYQTNWNSTTAANGAHTVTATVREAGGATVTSPNVQITVNNPVPDGTNIIPNPGVETVGTGNMPASWQTGTWGTNNATFRYLVDGVHSGSRALKVNIGTYTDGDAKWYFTPQAIDGSKLYNFRNYYKSNVQSSVVAEFGMADGSYRYVTLGQLSPASSWAKFEQQFSVPEGATSVTVFHLLNRVGWLVTDDYHLAPYSPEGFNRALISITFDDSWASVYNNAFPLLQQYGFHSTQYMLSGMTAQPDYMTVAMMQAMKNAGEEIGSHTIDHSDLVTLTTAQQQQQLSQSKNNLQQWTGANVANFASPYGSVNPSVVTQIKKYYGSHRGVVAGYNSKNYFNAYDIKVQNVTNTTTLAQVEGWIAKAQATNTWLVLVYHQVEENPPAGEDATYNTTPAQLDAHFNAIKNSGIAVVTVGQALAELKPQL